MIFEEVDLKKSTEYAGEDADVTFRLFDILKSRLDEEKLNIIYETFEKPLVHILSQIEMNGVKINTDYRMCMSKKTVFAVLLPYCTK